MQKLMRALGVAVIGLSAAAPASASDIAIVVVPQGMILETQPARTSASPIAESAFGFVVTRDLRVDGYVVIAAGSRGVGHLTRAKGYGSALAGRVSYDYVVASDGTRIPVTGAAPYLTTRASRNVVMYDSVGSGHAADDASVTVPSDALPARP